MDDENSIHKAYLPSTRVAEKCFGDEVALNTDTENNPMPYETRRDSGDTCHTTKQIESDYQNHVESHENQGECHYENHEERNEWDSHCDQENKNRQDGDQRGTNFSENGSGRAHKRLDHLDEISDHEVFSSTNVGPLERVEKVVSGVAKNYVLGRNFLRLMESEGSLIDSLSKETRVDVFPTSPDIHKLSSPLSNTSDNKRWKPLEKEKREPIKKHAESSSHHGGDKKREKTGVKKTESSKPTGDTSISISTEPTKELSGLHSKDSFHNDLKVSRNHSPGGFSDSESLLTDATKCDLDIQSSEQTLVLDGLVTRSEEETLSMWARVLVSPQPPGPKVKLAHKSAGVANPDRHQSPASISINSQPPSPTVLKYETAGGFLNTGKSCIGDYMLQLNATELGALKSPVQKLSTCSSKGSKRERHKNVSCKNEPKHKPTPEELSPVSEDQLSDSMGMSLLQQPQYDMMFRFPNSEGILTFDDSMDLNISSISSISFSEVVSIQTIVQKKIGRPDTPQVAQSVDFLPTPSFVTNTTTLKAVQSQCYSSHREESDVTETLVAHSERSTVVNMAEGPHRHTHGCFQKFNPTDDLHMYPPTRDLIPVPSAKPRRNKSKRHRRESPSRVKSPSPVCRKSRHNPRVSSSDLLKPSKSPRSGKRNRKMTSRSDTSVTQHDACSHNFKCTCPHHFGSDLECFLSPLHLNRAAMKSFCDLASFRSTAPSTPYSSTVDDEKDTHDRRDKRRRSRGRSPKHESRLKKHQRERAKRKDCSPKLLGQRKQDSTAHGKQNNTSHGKQDSNVHGKQNSASHGKQDSNVHGKQDSNVNGKQNSTSHCVTPELSTADNNDNFTARSKLFSANTQTAIFVSSKALMTEAVETNKASKYQQTELGLSRQISKGHQTELPATAPKTKTSFPSRSKQTSQDRRTGRAHSVKHKKSFDTSSSRSTSKKTSTSAKVALNKRDKSKPKDEKCLLEDYFVQVYTFLKDNDFFSYLSAPITAVLLFWWWLTY